MKSLAEKLELETDMNSITYESKLVIVENEKTKIKENKIVEQLYLFLKRVLDVIIGICGCLALIPIMSIVKIAYLMDGDKSSILFKQTRIGKDGDEIEIYKIRSMVVDADKLLMEMLEVNPEIKKEYQENKKLKDDPRITKVGAFIRKTSLDEFPQFINVLKGEMSLVGPRPYLPREKEDMKKYYDDIIDCKPGITGLWQVSGRSNVSFTNRCRLDSFYNNHKGLLFDIKIFFKTFMAVLGKNGAV